MGKNNQYHRQNQQIYTQEKTVIIAVDDLTEFYAIEPDIRDMIYKGVPVKMLVVRSYSEEMFEETKKTIKKHGYQIVEDSDAELQCKVLLEPYPIAPNIKADFRIRYEYGVSPASVKPDPCYTPEWNLPYDAVICYSEIAQGMLLAYTKACIVKPQQFNEFVPHKAGEKANILVLLTWGDSRTTEKLDKIKKILGDRYNLIVKAHHAVQYRPDHQGIAEKLKKIADEYYDASTNVNMLFEKADIVLTDNSSAVFTAIYLGIPTAIYSEATSNYSELNGLKAAHFSLLIEPDLIPYTNEYKNIRSIVERAVENIAQQNKLKNKLYPSNVNETLSSLVEKYLQIDRNKEPYYILRKVLLERWSMAFDGLSQTKASIDILRTENDELKQELASFLSLRRSLKLLLGNIRRRIREAIRM